MSLFKQANEDYRNFLKTLNEPNWWLESIPFIEVKTAEDIKKIPKSCGCYWIWTNEPVAHTMHRANLPLKIDDGEIIYNGVATENVRDRLAKHLLGHPSAKYSAICLDLHMPPIPASHVKRAMSPDPKKKVPYIDDAPVKTHEQLFKMNLSQEEIDFASLNKELYFRNGINVTDPKHQRYSFRAYYLTDIEPGLASYYEIQWRAMHGRPRLCSYKSGR